MKKVKRKTKIAPKVEPLPVRLIAAVPMIVPNEPETIILIYEDGRMEKIEPVHINKFRRVVLNEVT